MRLGAEVVSSLARHRAAGKPEAISVSDFSDFEPPGRPDFAGTTGQTKQAPEVLALNVPCACCRGWNSRSTELRALCFYFGPR